MTIKSNLDLYLVALASLLLIPAVVLSGSIAVRLILTIPLLLFAPGYAIVSAFFPGKSGPSGIERITYGVVLSIAVVMLDGLLLNYIWSIDVYPLLITLEGLTLVLLIIAWLRRRSLTEDERLVFRSGASRYVSWIDGGLAVLLALAVIGAGAVAVYAGAKNTQPYSEFYLLGAEGKAAEYPQSLEVGQKAQLTLVVSNHEQQSMVYTIKINQQGGRVLIDGYEQNEASLTLASGQALTYAITFSFDNTGDAQKLEFDLYKANEADIYLQTYLKLDVTD